LPVSFNEKSGSLFHPKRKAQIQDVQKKIALDNISTGPTILHDVVTQNTNISIFIVVRTSALKMEVIASSERLSTYKFT
jgi:hypothetical protein